MPEREDCETKKGAKLKSESFGNDGRGGREDEGTASPLLIYLQASWAENFASFPDTFCNFHSDLGRAWPVDEWLMSVLSKKFVPLTDFPPQKLASLTQT